MQWATNFAVNFQVKASALGRDWHSWISQTILLSFYYFSSFYGYFSCVKTGGKQIENCRNLSNWHNNSTRLGQIDFMLDENRCWLQFQQLRELEAQNMLEKGICLCCKGKLNSNHNCIFKQLAMLLVLRIYHTLTKFWSWAMRNKRREKSI